MKAYIILSFIRAAILYTVICAVVSMLSIVISHEMLIKDSVVLGLPLPNIVSVVMAVAVLCAIGFLNYITRRVDDFINWRNKNIAGASTRNKDILFLRSRMGGVATFAIWAPITIIPVHYFVSIGNIIGKYHFDVGDNESFGVMLISVFGYFSWRNAVLSNNGNSGDICGRPL